MVRLTGCTPLSTWPSSILSQGGCPLFPASVLFSFYRRNYVYPVRILELDDYLSSFDKVKRPIQKPRKHDHRHSTRQSRRSSRRERRSCYSSRSSSRGMDEVGRLIQPLECCSPKLTTTVWRISSPAFPAMNPSTAPLCAGSSDRKSTSSSSTNGWNTSSLRQTPGSLQVWASTVCGYRSTIVILRMI